MPPSKNEALGEKEMLRILKQEDTGVLCTSDGGKPYAVPVSYAWIDRTIVIHCAVKGKKLDIISRSPRVCFVVSRHPDRIRPHHPEGDCNYRFESVLCFGRARIVKDLSERLKLLRRFKAHFYRRLSLDPKANPVSQAGAKGTGCLVISVSEMTGRRKS